MFVGSEAHSDWATHRLSLPIAGKEVNPPYVLLQQHDRIVHKSPAVSGGALLASTKCFNYSSFWRLPFLERVLL